MPYLQIFRFLLPYLIGAMIAGAAVWKIQGARIDTRDADIKVLKVNNEALTKANQKSQESITALRDDIKKAKSTCVRQIAIEQEKCDRIAHIDALKGGGYENDSIVFGIDAVHAELFGLFYGTAAGSGNAVHKAGDSADSFGAAALSCEVEGDRYKAERLYCLDEVNAKNLLKNQTLDAAYRAQLITVIEGMR
ncbi:MAG: hypothetical protein AB1553_02035 [Nitrospirota bacterium]